MAKAFRSRGWVASVLVCSLASTSVWGAEKPTEELVPAEILQKIDQAPQLEVEKLVQPITDIRGPRVNFVPNPKTGSYNALLHYFETYTRNHHIFIGDVASGQVKRIDMPPGVINTFFPAPDHGKIYFHTAHGLRVYDAATQEIRELPIRIGGETHPMTWGPDGMIYGTGSRGSQPTALRIDPRTDEVIDYGKVGPSHAPNQCWGYFVNADETHIYIASGKIPWRLVAFNRETKESQVLLTLDDPTGIIGFGVQSGRRVASVRNREANTTQRYWLGGGKVTLINDPKEAPPAHASNAPVSQGIGKVEVTGQWKPDGEGKVDVALKFADGKTGSLKFNVPTYPANLYQIIAGPDGKIYGSGGNYLGLFIYDPATNTSKHMVSAPASVPLLNWIDGKLVFTAYPSGVTLSYDPQKPWDHAKGNPARLTYLGNEGAGFHTPYAAVVGADGKLYAAGGWYRNGNGGGLGWVDTATKKAGGTHEGMGNYRSTNLVTVGNGRYMVMSTKTVRDQETNAPPPRQAKIFVYDIQEARMTSFETIADVNHTGAIAGTVGDSTTVVAITSHPYPADQPAEKRPTILYAFDALTGKVLWQKKLPYACGFLPNENYDGTVGFQITLGPDGMIWTYLGGEMKQVDPARSWGLALEDARLVRINPANGDIDVVGLVGMTGKMAFLGKDLYLTGGGKYYLEGSGAEYLRRIKNVLK